jgi:hypothetical protein
MTPTRNGKIAHLPLTLRNELNHRLDDGIPGHELIAWLNADPEVQRLLAQYFRGRRITQQNLSEWRCGGYQDWVKLQETRHLTMELAKEPETVQTDINPRKITNAIATITATEFAHTAQRRLRECADTKERWKFVCEMTTQLSRLRRDNCRDIQDSLRQQYSERRPSEGRVPNSTSIPHLPDATAKNSRHPQPASAPHQTKNQVENPHFPSGTDPNRLQKNSRQFAMLPIIGLASKLPSSRWPTAECVPGFRHSSLGFRNFIRGIPSSITNPSINSLPPILSLTLDHPATMFLTKPASTLFPPTKNLVKNPQFPSGTAPNQTRKM